jgi:hypothetical protein
VQCHLGVEQRLPQLLQQAARVFIVNDQIARAGAVRDQVRITREREAREAGHRPLDRIDGVKPPVFTDRVSVSHSRNVIGNRAGPQFGSAGLMVHSSRRGSANEASNNSPNDLACLGRHPHHAVSG